MTDAYKKLIDDVITKEMSVKMIYPSEGELWRIVGIGSEGLILGKDSGEEDLFAIEYPELVEYDGKENLSIFEPTETGKKVQFIHKVIFEPKKQKWFKFNFDIRNSKKVLDDHTRVMMPEKSQYRGFSFLIKNTMISDGPGKYAKTISCPENWIFKLSKMTKDKVEKGPELSTKEIIEEFRNK